MEHQDYHLDIFKRCLSKFQILYIFKLDEDVVNFEGK